MRNNRDINILDHIVSHCDEIYYNVNRFGDSLQALQSDRSYKPAVAMHVLQIGELSALLTEEFKSNHPDIPWRQIKAMRNFAAHNYAKLDLEILWSTIKNKVPILHDFCLKTIELYDKMEQSVTHQPAQNLKPR